MQTPPQKTSEQVLLKVIESQKVYFHFCPISKKMHGITICQLSNQLETPLRGVLRRFAHALGFGTYMEVAGMYLFYLRSLLKSDWIR